MNRSDRMTRPRIATTALLAVLVGCADGEFPRAPVSGTVTFDGQPLAGGSVVFQPVASAGQITAGRGSFGYCDENGRYSLETVDGQPGAVIADHRVRICAARPKKSSAIDGGDPNAAAYREPVPPRYNSKTELIFTVPSEGAENANFDLTSN